jgi:hypothetical protein
LVSGLFCGNGTLTDEQLVRHVLTGRTTLYERLMRRHACLDSPSNDLQIGRFVTFLTRAALVSRRY